jgi:hypothetical protein
VPFFNKGVGMVPGRQRHQRAASLRHRSGKLLSMISITYEIVEQSECLVYELDRETEKEKFTYAEIEENETELVRIHKWMQRIVAQDWFAASGRARAQQAIEDAEKRSAAYTEEVERRDGHAVDIDLLHKRHS